MNIIETPIAGLKLIELKIFSDGRGFFTERFNQSMQEQIGGFTQDNHSRSAPNVIRGMHYQQNPAQAKLVSCVSGKIYDVAVDIRASSPTFSKYFGVELDETKMLYIPAGFAHGFCVIGNLPADVTYKIDGKYNPQGEGSIRFDDAEIGINWPVKNPIISEKDLNAISFAQYKQNPMFK